MYSEVEVTCFADLKDSTPMTDELGHDGFRPYREEYLRVGKILATKCGGRYVKSIGDGHMVTFKQIEPAFYFASQLHQFYQKQPNYLKAPLTSRIGLFLGVVEPSKYDAYGSGVNQAARVRASSDPGSILVNKALMEAAGKIWGARKSKPLFSSKGEVELKGIMNPPKQELFIFNWQKHVKEDPGNSLSGLVFKHLQDASIIASNLTLDDVSNQSSIIWPVVPRNDVNAIHCGQLEIIRLLAMLGARVNVLIADCGATVNQPRAYSENFRDMITKHAAKRNLRDINYIFMSDMFTPRCKGCDEFHRHFQSVISQLTLQELLHINQKEYARDVREAIKKAPTLDFLNPALTISSVLHLSNQIGKKCVVVAGHDERIQWESAHQSIPNTRTQFGVLFNPILKKKTGAQGRQTSSWPLYFAWQPIVEDMRKYDLAKWLTQLHLFLSSFPASSANVGRIRFSPRDWQNGDKVEKRVDKEALAQNVFANILRP